MGLEYKEIKTQINTPSDKRLIPEKYVCICTESTAQAKYWNNPTGWRDVAKYLTDAGYKVINISQKQPIIENVLNPKINTILDVQQYLSHCEFFVGLPSGVSWVAWAMNKKVVMISGFSYPWCEFSEKISVTPSPTICQGCFNWKNQVFDKSWEFCPKYRGTPDAYICTKSISASDVIKKLQSI